VIRQCPGDLRTNLLVWSDHGFERPGRECSSAGGPSDDMMGTSEHEFKAGKLVELRAPR
jgi:hypothetical protein